MKLPVDTSAIAFLCALAPEPVVDFETKRPRADENGEPLYVVQLLAMGDGSADLLAVKVPGVPGAGVRQGAAGQGRRAGRPALDDGRPVRGVVPRRPDRAGHRPSQGELTERRDARPSRRDERRGRQTGCWEPGRPLHHQAGCSQHPALASGSGAHDAYPSYARDQRWGSSSVLGGVYDSQLPSGCNEAGDGCTPRSATTPAATSKAHHPRPPGRPPGAGRRPGARRPTRPRRPSCPASAVAVGS